MFLSERDIYINYSEFSNLVKYLDAVGRYNASGYFVCKLLWFTRLSYAVAFIPT